MRLTNRIKQAGATGYILLWLLGIPIPICSLSFCSEVAPKDFGGGLALSNTHVRAINNINFTHIKSPIGTAAKKIK